MPDNSRLQRVLHDQQLQALEPIQQNPRKGSSVWLVADASNRKMLLKLRESDTPVGIDGFSNELAYYQAHRANYLPALLLSGEDFLCLEYIEGSSLLAYLSGDHCSAEVTRTLPTRLVELAECFTRSEPVVPGEVDEFAAVYMQKLSKLINSGPWGHKRSRLEDIVVGFCWRLIKRPLRTRVRQLLIKSPPVPVKSAVHNDFHLNNMLITKENRLYLIDFENYGEGYSRADLIYGLSTLYATRRVDYAAIQAATTTTTRETPVLGPLLAVSLCGVQVNRKFYAGTAANIAKNLLKLGVFALFGTPVRPS